MGQGEEELDDEAEGVTFDPLLANAEDNQDPNEAVRIRRISLAENRPQACNQHVVFALGFTDDSVFSHGAKTSNYSSNSLRSLAQLLLKYSCMSTYIKAVSRNLYRSVLHTARKLLTMTTLRLQNDGYVAAYPLQNGETDPFNPLTRYLDPLGKKLVLALLTVITLLCHVV